MSFELKKFFKKEKWISFHIIFMIDEENSFCTTTIVHSAYVTDDGFQIAEIQLDHNSEFECLPHITMVLGKKK